MSKERVAKILTRARAALSREDAFAHRVTLDFGEDGAIHVDGPAGEARAERAPAECTVRVSLEDFIAIARGALDPGVAYLKGKIAVDGDVALAVALAQRMRAARED